MPLPDQRNWLDEPPRRWGDWREWAEELAATHSLDQVLDSLADLGADATQLREGYCSEAYIVMVQTQDVKALGKGRKRILAQQALRMASVGLAKALPRSAGSASRAREMANDVLASLALDERQGDG